MTKRDSIRTSTNRLFTCRQLNDNPRALLLHVQKDPVLEYCASQGPLSQSNPAGAIQLPGELLGYFFEARVRSVRRFSSLPWRIIFNKLLLTGLGPCLPNNLSTYGARRFHRSRSEWDRVFSRLTVVPGLSWFPIDEQEGKWNSWILWLAPCYLTYGDPSPARRQWEAS